MTSVVIVDQQRSLRDNLQNLLNRAEGFRCVGTFKNAETAIRGIGQLHPKVVLIDIDLPKMSGIDCVRILRQKFSELSILVLTSNKEDHIIFESLQAGADGYLVKNVFPSKLLNAIREVESGGAPMSAYVAKRVVSSFRKRRNAMGDLSQREQEVLRLLCRGQSYRDIADALFVSTNTVRFHLKNIYKKLEVSSRHEAVMKATRLGAA